MAAVFRRLHLGAVALFLNVSAARRIIPLHLFELAKRIAWHASLTALPSSRVESVKISSPYRLKTTILLRRWRYPLPPSWSSVTLKSAFATLFVTATSGQR